MNTSSKTNTATADVAAATAAPHRRPSRRWVLAGAALVAVIAAAVVVALVVTSDGDSDDGAWQTADVPNQGGADPVLASNGARLLRRADGLVGELEMPTPEPGSYEYPPQEVAQDWADPYHPPVDPGAADAPEAFTAWIIVFNDPALCTDNECGGDDIAPDAAARGGAYQLDGQIADGDTLHFAGNVRLGQPPMGGSPLDDPLHALVHILIAPHGRALSGADLVRQLNGPIGTPGVWWGAEFLPA